MRDTYVVAITVTYNRTDTLKRCIQALLDQTSSVDHIIVVDNNSKPEEKIKLSKFAEGQNKLQVLWLEENFGGAGGFEAGMALARKQFDPDWYWIMDDDAYPRPDCLKQLLEKGSELLNVGCLVPAIFGIDIQEYQMYHHKRLSSFIFEDIQVAEKYEKLGEITELEANAFVGPLFSRGAVEYAGIADGSLFIYGDDTEYTYRVSRNKKIYLIKEAIIDHQDPPVRNSYMQPEAWWKEYYRIRNRFFLFREFHKNKLVRLSANICMSCSIFKLMVAAALKPKYKGHRKLRLWLLKKAMVDGLLNNRGRSVDPAQYRNML